MKGYQEKLAAAVLSALRSSPTHERTADELTAALDTPPRARKHLRAVLSQLVADGTLRRNRGGAYTVGEAPPVAVGTLSVHPRGFGFVTQPGGGPDLFIPPGALGEAISGDLVQVQITDPANPRGPVGRVTAIQERRPAELVGELRGEDGEYLFRPLRRDLPAAIPVTGPPVSSDQSVSGRWVAARLIRAPNRTNSLSAEVLRDLGSVHEVEGCLQSVTEEYRLCPPYTPGQARAARGIEPRVVPREDLQALTVLTIDPVDAKDFDDGISIQPGSTPDTAWAGIHIADVAAYVAPGTEFDRNAAERGFTAYLPGRTLPMLPGPLAGDRCSLIAGQPRLAHSVFVEVACADGRVLRTRRCHSLIRVRARLTFDAVAGFLEHGTPIAAPPEVQAALADLANLALAMRARRAREEAFLDLAGDLVRVRCAEDPPRIVELVRESSSLAHALVEEFMLAANSAVAAELAARGIPGVFRCHAKPKRADLEAFTTWVNDAFGLVPKRWGNRAAMNRFLRALDSPAARVLITQEFLRSLPRAEYAADCLPHFGLGKDCYCHFTSPIRRYPDLVVHQQLWAADHGETTRSAADCRAVCIRATAQEQQVDYAFFAANDRLKLLLLRDRLRVEPGLLLEGMVVRETADGVTVFLPEFGLFGLLPGKGGSVNRGWSEGAGKRGGRGTGKTHKCGDFIMAQPRTVDCVRGTLELQPARVRLPGSGFRPARARA